MITPTMCMLLTGKSFRGTWAEWKVRLCDNGYVIVDKSDFVDTDFLDSDEAQTGFAACEITEEVKIEQEKSVDEWRKEYQEYQDNPPDAGDIIRTEDGEPVRLEIELRTGKAPFIYARIYIPNVVGSALGWFARPFSDSSPYGWKVILAPRARDSVIKKRGIGSEAVPVKSLKILRRSQNSSSFVAEVDQW